MDPLIAAVDPKSVRNYLLDLYLLTLARHIPNVAPISPNEAYMGIAAGCIDLMGATACSIVSPNAFYT